MDKQYEKMLGKNIRFIREHCGLTQDKVVEMLQSRGCKMTRSAFAKIETGWRHLYPDEIVHLKNVLNVSYDELFDINNIFKKLFEGL